MPGRSCFRVAFPQRNTIFVRLLCTLHLISLPLARRPLPLYVPFLRLPPLVAMQVSAIFPLLIAMIGQLPPPAGRPLLAPFLHRRHSPVPGGSCFWIVSPQPLLFALL